MSASFTPEERRLQKLVLAKGDPTGTGVLTGEAAVKIFAESNLPPATLGGIWALADVENNGYLTGRGLLIALRLIGWAQSGDEDPNEMLIKKAGPLAKLPSFSSISESLNPFSPPILPNTAAGRAPQLTPEDRSKFIRLFNTIKPVNGFITGEKGKEIFLKSGLPLAKLGYIWNLADTKSRGCLDQTDFILGMYFIQLCMSQPSYDLPSTLPQGLYEQANGSVNPIDLRGETTSFPAPKVQNPFSAHTKKQSTAFQRPHSLSSISKHRPSSTYDTSIASSNYPWHRNNVDEFQFLHTSNVFSVADLGISREIYGECTEYIMEDLLVLTSRERATIFNIRTKGIREFKLFQDMLFPAIPDERSACIVSPDGSIIVHRSPSGNITSYRLKDKTFQSSLPPNHKNIQEEDLLNAYWPTSNTVYIPVQSGDCIIRWAFSDDSQTEAIRSLHPMRAVTRHQQLDIFVTSNEQWWIAMGTTWETSGPGVESGMIEIHDVVNEESRLFPGKACCIVETLVYDKPSALLVRADGTMSGKISLSVHSISSSEPEGEQFQPVDILVDVRHPKDSPIRIFSLGSLPIVCLITAFRAIYFFELHIGSLLYCIEAPDHGIDLYPVRFQGRRGEGFYCFDGNGVMRWVTVKKDDLIGWVRRILNDDTLASAIAIRTGLPGAEDVVLDDMFGTITTPRPTKSPVPQQTPTTPSLPFLFNDAFGVSTLSPRSSIQEQEQNRSQLLPQMEEPALEAASESPWPSGAPGAGPRPVSSTFGTSTHRPPPAAPAPVKPSKFHFPGFSKAKQPVKAEEPAPIPAGRFDQTALTTTAIEPSTAEGHVKMICNLGFTRDQAVTALEKHSYNLERAIGSLLVP